MLLLQLLAIMGISYSFFDTRKLVLFEPYQVLLRSLFAAAIWIVIENEFDQIKKHLHASFRARSAWQFRRMRFYYWIRSTLTNYTLFIILAYTFTTDSEFEETVMDQTMNFSALLVLIDIDAMVLGSLLRKGLPSHLFEFDQVTNEVVDDKLNEVIVRHVYNNYRNTSGISFLLYNVAAIFDNTVCLLFTFVMGYWASAYYRT